MYRPALEDSPDERDVQLLRKRLIEYNIARSHIDQSQNLAIWLRDDEDQIVGGITGWIWGQVLEIQFLWVSDELRGQGYGKRLLLGMEQAAAVRGCSQIIVDTYSFQAPGFYQKLGYEILGAMEGYPQGYRKLFFRKGLS